MNQRGTVPGADLNRSFTKVSLMQVPHESDSYELQRARELMSLLKQTDRLLDIHSTSQPSQPFVCLGEFTPEHGEFCKLMPTDRVLTDPHTVLPQGTDSVELGTTDHAVNVYGGSAWSERKYGVRRGIGFCYESGHFSDHSKEDEVFSAVFRYLRAAGIVQEFSEEYVPSQQRVFRLVERIFARYDGFEFHSDIESWKSVVPGMILGQYDSNGEEHLFSDHGIILFPSGRDVSKKGAELCYVAVEV